MELKEIKPKMGIQEAKTKFIFAWGTMASDWGISRSMAQVHAILLTSGTPLNTEEVMEQLKISRGSANMNLRDLIDWGLISKVHIAGERVEYFEAEKDPWKIFKKIAGMKKRREIDPLLTLLKELDREKYPKGDKEAADFQKTIGDIHSFGKKMDGVIETIIKSDESWFLNSFMKIIMR